MILAQVKTDANVIQANIKLELGLTPKSSSQHSHPLTFSDILVIQHVISSIAVDPVHSEDLDDGVAEAAHGLCGGAFYEDHHFVLLHHLLQSLLGR